MLTVLLVYHAAGHNQYKYRTQSGHSNAAVLACAADMEPPVATPLAMLRRRKLLSQRALASQAGVALSTVYLLEAGKTQRVTFKVMRAVSDALGVPPENIAEFRRAMDQPA